VSLRAKLLAAMAPLLIAMLVMVVVGSRTTTALGDNSRRILNENYRSVLAAQRMKESIEQIDRECGLVAAGQAALEGTATSSARKRFDDELGVELHNITEPGEAQTADTLRRRWLEYERALDTFSATPSDERGPYYFSRLAPAFLSVEESADLILEMNQRAMLAKSDHAGREAWRWNRIVLAVGTGGSVLALALTTAWLSRLLRPLRVLASTSRRIGHGDLGARAIVRGSDEIARLARDFNDMAERLQQYRKSSLGQLLQAQQNLQAAIDSMPDPIIVVDVDGTLTQTNRAAQTTLRVRPIALATAWTSQLSVGLRAAIERARGHVLSGRGPLAPPGIEDSVMVEAPEGPKQFIARAEPTYDEDGTVTGATILLQDVTRIVRLDELRSNLVATVAHEFRTPLTSLRMAIHLCAEGMVGPLTEKQSELLFTARDECERLQSIVDELLNASRMQDGKLVLHRTSTAADAIVDGALRALHAAGEARGLTLRTQYLPGLGSVSVDREHMNILMSNLVTNAFQHSPAGGEVTLGAKRVDRTIEFDVRDQGPGLAYEYQSAVFEPHFQAPGGHHGASGLGLSIAKRIVEEHGGEIGVDSQPGAGARFWFRLPRAVHEQA
jgi:signal transduction histidine kinase